MVHLTLAGVSDDARRLLLVSDSGEQYTLTIDDKLRAALRGEHARIGQLEIHMDSALRPRDIQARIRAGDTPEAVAQAAQTTVDKVMPYANPVLAERAHVATRAQRSSVRRKAGDGGARTLGDAVASTLRHANVDPETVEWDAWRREDGKWVLTGTYAAPKRKGTAKFTFDMPGNYVSVDNDDARWLIGEATSKPASGRDDLQQRRRARGASPADGELPLGDDAIELVTDEPAPAVDPALEATPEPLADAPATDATADAVSATDDTAELTVTPPAEETTADTTAATTRATGKTRGKAKAKPAPVESAPESTPEPAAEPTADPASEAASEVAEEPAEEPAPPRKSSRRKGRASVPSWDEIMFGGGKSE